MRHALLGLLLIFSGIVKAQTVAEVSYLSKTGTVTCLAAPDQKVYRGQGFSSTDELILEKNAQIRLYFLDKGTSKKFSAPAHIKIGAEIESLQNAVSDTLKDDISAWLRYYSKPAFSNHAGARSSARRPGSVVSPPVKTYLTNPHVVVQGDGKPHALSLKEDSQKLPTLTLNIPARSGLITLQITGKNLEHGRVYSLSIDDLPGILLLQITGRQEATGVTTRLKQLRDEAFDLIDFNERAAAFLAKTGYVAEAFYHVERGLALDRSNSALGYLKNSIANALPFMLTSRVERAANKDIKLNYSLHCRRGDEYEEIYDQSVMHSGDELQLRLLASQDCYVFIVNLNALGDVHVLYPLIGEDHFLAAGKMSILPSEFTCFRVDSTLGTEKIYVIASIDPLDYFARQLDAHFNRDRRVQEPFDVLANLGGTENEGMQETPAGQGTELYTDPAGGNLSRWLQGSGRIVREITLYHDR